MSAEKRLSRRQLLREAAVLGLGLGFAGPILAACGPTPTPKVIEKVVEKPVEKVVKETVVVEKVKEVPKEVVKEVTKVVEKPVEKVVKETVVVEKVKEVPVAKGVVILRVHKRLGDEVIWPTVAKVFEEKKPNVKVEYQSIPVGSDIYGPKVLTMHAAKDIGDVTWTGVGTGSFQFLAVNEVTMALDDRLKADPEVKFESYWDIGTAIMKVGPEGLGTGKIYGLPLLVHSGNAFLAINLNMFQAAGLKPPDVNPKAEQIIELALKLTDEKAKKFGFLPCLVEQDEFGCQVRSFCGESLSKDGKKATFNEKGMKDAVRWVYDCFFYHKVTPLAAQIPEGGTVAFYSGRIAIMTTGPSIYGSKKTIEEKTKWDLIPGLVGPCGWGTQSQGDGVCITKLAKNPDMAWEFIKMATGPVGGLITTTNWGVPCPRDDVVNDPTVQKDPMLKRSIEYQRKAKLMHSPANLRVQEYNTTFTNVLAGLWTGDNKPDDKYFDDTQKILQEVLDKPLLKGEK